VSWATWAALVSFPAALLPVLPGDLRASKLYGSNFWSKPSSALMKQTYIDYFTTNWRFLVILLIAGLIVSLVLVEGKRAEELAERKRGFSGPEWMLVGLLTALPAYVLPASYLMCWGMQWGWGFCWWRCLRSSRGEVARRVLCY
jgi:hypothetical protein